MKKVMKNIVDAGSRAIHSADTKLFGLYSRIVLDDGGQVALEVILGILVSIVLIAIVLTQLRTSTGTWLTSITDQFNDILGGDF